MPFGIGPQGRGRGQRRRIGRGRWAGSSFGGTAAVTPAVTVDTKKCVGCGKCASACPFDAISIVDGKAVVDASRCRDCRACVSACPTGAIG